MSNNTNIFEILKSYWGYSVFREPQQQIIEATLRQEDILALLPTGGGKSICFQVPAMAMDGVCLVVSPLIALMKDQVENLNKRGIQAHAIYSGLHHEEIKTILGNCLFGGVKFLYLSPERLASETIKEYLQKMPVNLLAIDEAHCISQWGHEFRPEYRRIAEVRLLLPNVPVLALTASATPDVVEDIMEQLAFKKKLVFKKSFERQNLHYVVRKTEDKYGKLLQSIKGVKGSGLVYVRNRKMTAEIADYLNKNGIVASYYHAGLESSERSKRQEDWIKGKVQIMACTNAFGMGIDKPDCRLVIHFEMPDCLEAYYQEAGRAGRDGNKAYCLLLYHGSDAAQALAKLEQQYPEPEYIRLIYEQLGSYLRIPIGEQTDDFHALDLAKFSLQIKQHPIKVNAAINLLSQCEVIQLSEGFFEQNKLKINLSPQALQSLQNQNEKWFSLLQLLLRMQGGLFEEAKAISLNLIAMKANLSEGELLVELQKMQEHGFIEFSKASALPSIQFINERVDKRYLKLDTKRINQRKQVQLNKLEAMIKFADSDLICRSRSMLLYFGESNAGDCGACDICLEKDRDHLTQKKLDDITKKMSQLKGLKPLSMKELGSIIKGVNPKDLVSACRFLADKGVIALNYEQEITWIGEK